MKTSINKLIENGIANKQVKAETNADFYGIIVIATLEGGIMMSKLERSKDAITKIIAHLRELVIQISE